MNETIQISIAVEDEQIREQLIAQLSLEDFDGFEETDSELIAFINSNNYNSTILESILLPYNLFYKKTVIEDQNWNALWESNFSPVIVNNFCAIRAGFHKAIVYVQHEIIITPKMSFGTGHHATTYMMISEMSKLNFKDKKIADFGTGTGVLSILAEKLGSSYVWAIDNDDWSIANATENIENNGCKSIVIEKKDCFNTTQQFDIILANINKNVILTNTENLFSGCKYSSLLLLSGLLKEDENDIVSAFISKGFKHMATVEKNNWICLLLKYV